MAENTVAGLCRLTVHASGRKIDLAVPADIPVADLLPTLVEYAGENLAESGLEHGGWLLQRLDGTRLDEESSPDALGLMDGETVHLRPHTDALPEIHLDDLVDGIATTMQDRAYTWTPQVSRRVLLTLGGAASVAAFAFLAVPGFSAGIRAVGAATFALLFLAGAGAASRAVGDSGAGAALGLPVVCFLGLAGWLAPGGDLSGPHALEALGNRLLASGAAAAGGAMLAVAVVGSFAALFVAAAVIAFAGTLVGVLMSVAGLEPNETAGLIALLAVIFGAFVPSLSFRLAGLRLPALPTNAQQLQEGIEPHSPSAVATRVTVADDWMTGLYTATGVVCGAALVGLTAEPELAGVLTAGVLSLLLLLHSRGLGNTLQRLALLVPSSGGAALLAYDAGISASPLQLLLLAASMVSITATLAIAAWTVPGRRLVPYWGRAAELLHSAAALSMLPMALWVLGLFGYLHSLKG